MNYNIDIEGIVMMLNYIPSKYNTETMKKAKGKYVYPSSIKKIFKKLKNG
jgi:hypothetical protein